METALEKPAVRAWVKPDHKLEEWEIADILEHWDYEPDYDGRYDEYNENGSRLLFDEFGNPSYGTFESMYEEENGLLNGPFTLEELFDEFDKWRAEVDDETD